MKSELIEKLKSKKAVIGIVGLGYVGLPLALRYCEVGYNVVGLDIDQSNPFAALSAMMTMLSAEPPHGPKGPGIAVLHIDGAIIDGESSAGGFMGGSSVGSRTIRNALSGSRNEC